jgi:serine phosphatase RsbU (regulator of sigma subunit)
MTGKRFPRDRAAAARAAAENVAARSAATEAVAVCTRYRGLDGPGTAGGDFYASCETRHGTRVIIGDVRGKGAPAARKARFLASAFLVLAAARSDFEAVSRTLDHLVAANAAAEWDAAAREWFATAVLLEIDRRGRGVTVINHGHPAPVLVGAGTVRELVPSRPRLPLGLGDLVTVGGFADTVELAADSTLLLFTDGVSEARDRLGRMFDPVSWLTAAAAAARAADAVPADPAALLDDLLVEVERHNGGAWRDDLALVSVRRSAAAVDGPATPAPPGRPPGATPSEKQVPSSRVPPVTLPPAMAPPAQATRRPVAPVRPRAPRNPSRRPGGPPFPDGSTLP